MSFRLRFIVPLLLLYVNSYSQSTTDEIYDIVSEIMEQSTSENPNSAEFNTIFERLVNYHNTPLNINKASRLELESLFFLKEEEIDLILNYRKKLSSFVELQELIFAGINSSTYLKLTYFITLKPSPITDDFKLKTLKTGNHEMFSRWYRVIENQKGYKNNGFLGDPNKVYTRYKYSLNDKIQAGFTLEKDAGEQFKTNSTALLIDYLNAHLFIKTRHKIKTLALGAYSLNLGQGLLAWNGFALGKSSLLNLNKKSSREISPYSSANESNFLRGVATQIELKEVLITPYISYKKIDSRVTEDSTGNFSSSIPIIGLHRTSSELETKNKNHEFISGVSISKFFKHLHVRGNYQYLRYEVPLRKEARLYQVNDFEGDRLHSFSLDYKFRRNKTTFFGEHSIQSEGKKAHLSALTLKPMNKLLLTILYRNYSSGYFTPYNAGFGEKSKTKNESGIYLSSEFSLGRKTTLKLFIDSYKRKSPSFESKTSYNGEDLFLQLTQSPNSMLSHYFRFQYERNNGSSSLEESQTNSITRARYHLNLELRYNLSLRTRIEGNVLNKSSYGFLIYQDIKYRIPKTKVSLNFRYAKFNTPTFNQAIYAYENDVLFYFNIPSYSSNGTRVYALVSFPLKKHIKIWLRFSQWNYENRNTISSGNTEISGNKKTDIHFQTQFSF